MSNIPKIIHQLWIGPKPPPTKFMQTWKDTHEKLGFEYIFWNEQEFIKRGFTSQLQSRIDSMSEWNGKADILRWEILYKYGGVFVDADSICVEPFDILIQKYKAFAGYENEKIRLVGHRKATMMFLHPHTLSLPPEQWHFHPIMNYPKWPSNGLKITKFVLKK